MWHNRAVANGSNDPVTIVVRTVFSPIIGTIGTGKRWVFSQLEWVFRSRNLISENEQLKNDIAQLHFENDRLRESEATAERLRLQLGLPQIPAKKRIGANVIGFQPVLSMQTILIDQGSRNGINNRSVAVAPSGIVGRVIETTPTTATILLLTDRNAAIGAMVQRPESRAVGVCKGFGTGLLSLAYLDDDADVKPGDTIISSGLGGNQGVFPKGLVIGSVKEVVPDASLGGKRVSVQPAVEFKRLEEVYVLR
jgi:rod shape-determining protein MreC